MEPGSTVAADSTGMESRQVSRHFATRRGRRCRMGRRPKLDAESVVPPKSGRRTRKWPRTRWRREMRRSFPRDVYGQRWRVESAFSRKKRRLGSELRATSWAGQKREIRTRVLTHDLMILRRQPAVFDRAPPWPIAYAAHRDGGRGAGRVSRQSGLRSSAGAGTLLACERGTSDTGGLDPPRGASSRSPTAPIRIPEAKARRLSRGKA